MKVKTLSEAERWTVPILAANPSGNSTRVCVCVCADGRKMRKMPSAHPSMPSIMKPLRAQNEVKMAPKICPICRTWGRCTGMHLAAGSTVVVVVIIPAGHCFINSGKSETVSRLAVAAPPFIDYRPPIVLFRFHYEVCSIFSTRASRGILLPMISSHYLLGIDTSCLLNRHWR